MSDEVKVGLKAFDPENLYEERVVVDPGAGKIVCLIPIEESGRESVGRAPKFLSSVTVNFRGMARAIGFEIEAQTLGEAVGKWRDAAESAGKDWVEKAESEIVRRQLVGGHAAGPAPRQH